MKNNAICLLLLAAFLISTTGCSKPDESSAMQPLTEAAAATVAASTEVPTTEPMTESPTESTTESTTETTADSTEPTEELLPTETIPLAEGFSLSDVPEYSGSPYVEINGNTPFFAEYPSEVFELYSPLDELGRCGAAYATVCEALMPTEERGQIGMIKPSGWQTANYAGIIEDIYLYNRCHLIGYQLTGENDNERNLITGTRYMNVEGMEPFECKVANYVKSFHATVLYRVTPVFSSDDLVAHGVLMEAMSLDASAAELQFCVFCYNVQPNIEIDYATGESRALIDPEATAPTEPPTTEPALIIPTTEGSQDSIDRTMPTFSEDVTYILNAKSMKFHYPSCPSVADIAEYNRFEFKGTRDEAIKAGYKPCKRCNP